MQDPDEQTDSLEGRPPSRMSARSGEPRATRSDKKNPRRRRQHEQRSSAQPSRAEKSAADIQRIEEPDRLVAKGEEARKQRRIGEALNCFKRALTLDPSNIDAFAGLGFTYLGIRDYTSAFDVLEQGLEQNDEDGRLVYGAAIALKALNRPDAALSHAMRLIERHDRESRSNGHYIAGDVAYARGEFAVAAEHLDASLALLARKPRRSRRVEEIRIMLADAYQELDRPEQALRLFHEVLQRRWSRSIEDRAGRLCLELGHISDAKASFRRILDKHPDDVRALTGLGRVHLHQHEYADAIKAFAKALRHKSNDLHALDGIAEAYKGTGNLDKAAGYIQQVQEIYRLPEAQVQRRLNALAQERERRNAELLRMRNIASLNVMATGIAHELRQPLAAIRLAAQNARRDFLDGQTNAITEDLDDIDEHVEKIDRIIHLLRDMSAASGSNPESLLLDAVVGRALEFFHRQLAHRHIQVRRHDLDLRVIGDESALLQILANLIGNARDAMAQSDAKCLEIWAVPAPNRVILYLRDTGAGMSREVRRQAFDPFFSTKNNEGVGVGLYIAYNLARKMSGTLSIKKTAPGRGTTMELTLPLAAGGE